MLSNQNSKPNKKQKIKEKVYELSINSTSHGIPQALRNSHASLKILWTVCFLVSAVLCAIVVINSIDEYFEYDVVTKIRVIEKESLEFPTITLCHTSPFSTRNGSDFFWEIVLNHTKKFADNKNFTLFNYTSYLNTELVPSLYYQLNNPKFNDNQKKSLGLSIENMLYYCQFHLSECNSRNFKWYFHLEYGNCYQFNTPSDDFNGNTTQSFSAEAPGETGGLQLILFIGDSANRLFSNGLKVFVDDFSVKQFLVNDIEVKPNAKTSIGLRKIVTRKYPYPYSDCAERQSFFYKETVKLYKKYNKFGCIELGYQRFIIDNCGCSISKSNVDLFKAKPCASDKEKTCADEAYKKNIDKLRNLLTNECPNECETASYESSYSVSDFSVQQYYDLYRNKFNLSEDEDLRKKFNNGIKLNVYFPQLKYTEVSETPKVGVISLISNIGGTLGLFLGISLLSFVEIVEILIEILFILFRKK